VTVATALRSCARSRGTSGIAKADDGKAISFVISTNSVDRMGDVINVHGWKTAAFTRNPTVLWAHNHHAPPIGRATKLWREGNALKASMVFASSAFAQQIKQHVRERTLNATSVGFRPLRWSFSRDPSRQGGIDLHESELMEFPIVMVPANSEALLELSAADKARAKMRRELDLIRLRG
jgi:HK97 family phage prohead protease